MMKSFFKKLSFVMALAMVVSMMAPAASAYAAEAGIALQGTKEVVTEYNVEKAGEEVVDFCFLGAPADWKTTYKWESSDETVATVDKAGKVTALKNGEVTITITAGADASYKQEVKLTVGEVVADDSFEVKQIAADKVKLTFADATKATTDVTLYKVFELTSGSVEVKWPAEVTVKDGVATVDAYVDFVDGELFTIKVADQEPVPFVAYVGPITNIVVIPYDVKSDKAVTYGDGTAAYPVKFVTKYYAGDIEVSPAANSWMTFEALDANENIYVDSTGNSSFIYAVGAGTRVKATYSYYDANYAIQELTYEFPLVGQAVPVAALDGVTNYTIVAAGTEAKDVKWGTTELIVGDTGYYAGLQLADTLGGKYAVNANVKDVAAYGNQFGTLKFKSSDESKLLIGNDGYVTAIAEGKAVVIVQLETTNNGTTVTKNIYAFEVTLKPARKATTIVPSANTVTVLTNDNTSNDALTTAKVTFEVKDNHNGTCAISSATVTSTATGAPALEAKLVDGKWTIEIVGSKFASMNVSSVVYTIEAAGVKQNIVVVLKKPATSENNVVTTGYAVETTGADINVEKTGDVVATITNYTTWAGYKTGYVTGVKAFEDSKFFTENKTGLKIGDLVVKVTNAKGEVVAPVVNGDGTATIKVATVASGSAISVAAGAGVYNVTLYSVTNVTPNTGAASGSSLIAYRQVATNSFEIKNTCKTTSVKSFAEGLTSYANNIKDAVASIVTCTFDGKDRVLTANDIVRVNGVLNDSADKCYVSSIVVKTYINGTGCWFEQELAINKTITVPGVTSLN